MPIRFYLHTTRYADGRRPVYADVRWGRGEAATEDLNRLRTSTGQACQPDNWNEAKQRIKSAEAGYARSNKKLAELEADAGRYIEQAELNKTPLTGPDLLDLLKPGKRKKASATALEEDAPPVITIDHIYKEWRHAYRARLATKTLDGPKGLINRLEEWRPGVPARADEFQPDAAGRCALLEEFCTWCVEHARLPQSKQARGIYNNTIGTYLKCLRKLLKFAGRKFDWIEDDFSEDVDREALTYAEVMQIYQHEPLELKEGSTNYISRRVVRDLFVFNCLTGPRYGNLATLKPSDVVLETMTNPDTGESWQQPIIEYVQRKNRRQLRKIRVALDPVAYEIWQRYEGQLPVPANATMNAQIKTLCRAAGLKRTVTHVRGSGAERIETAIPLWQAVSCHTARYTFVTLQYEGGTDIVFIQDSVGHASLTTTRKYLKTRLKERLASTLTAFDKLRERDAQKAQQ